MSAVQAYMRIRVYREILSNLSIVTRFGRRSDMREKCVERKLVKAVRAAGGLMPGVQPERSVFIIVVLCFFSHVLCMDLCAYSRI